MSEEERKEEGQEVAPEVRATWAELERLMKRILEVVADPKSPPTLREMYAELVEKWLGIALSDDVPKAFWEEVLRLTTRGYWRVIEANLEGHSISGALEQAEKLVESLKSFAGLLGVEIPPEEVAEAPSVAEEVKLEVVEGTPLRELGLSDRAYNRLVRSKALAEAVGIAEGDSRLPYAEEVARVFAHGAKGMTGEEFFLNISLFGPKSFAELKEKLKKYHFIVEPWEE